MVGKQKSYNCANYRCRSFEPPVCGSFYVPQVQPQTKNVASLPYQGQPPFMHHTHKISRLPPEPFAPCFYTPFRANSQGWWALIYHLIIRVIQHGLQSNFCNFVFSTTDDKGNWNFVDRLYSATSVNIFGHPSHF